MPYPYTMHKLRLDPVRPRYALAVLAARWAICLGVLWPWMMRWGATELRLAYVRRIPSWLRLSSAF